VNLKNKLIVQLHNVNQSALSCKTSTAEFSSQKRDHKLDGLQ